MIKNLFEPRAVELSVAELLTLLHCLHIAIALHTFFNTGKLEYDYLYSKIEKELSEREKLEKT